MTRDQLNDLLASASAAIAEVYYQLPIHGGPPKWRERVYCYELYHQLRCRWPADCDFILTGEVDKRAHPIFRWLQAQEVIPDLLIHTPGNMAGNHAIIEVKTSEATRAGIRKDIETLHNFREQIGYERAIYLLYGYDAPLDAVFEEAGKLVDIRVIEVWHHPAPGQPAQQVGSFGKE